MSQQRIIGLDLARSIAIFGMILVNFKMVLGNVGESSFKWILDLFDGKAAATFVVLAGVGLALTFKAPSNTHSRYGINQTTIKICKRAAFLFVIGLIYIPIWPADILHFYGIYMLLSLIAIFYPKLTWPLILLQLVAYPVLILKFNYEQGWDFNTLTYVDFWTTAGFIRNLFYNGFHPVVPWSAFMLVGIWFGRKDLSNRSFLKRAVLVSGLIFILVHIASNLGKHFLPTELELFVETTPMPPLPFYFINGASIAILIISSSVLIGLNYPKNSVVKLLCGTGKLALTFYVAHVIFGMGIPELLAPDRIGDFKWIHTLLYTILFCCTSVIFSFLWLRKFIMGPLEWLMRTVTQ